MDQVVSSAAHWTEVLQPYALPIYLGAAFVLLCLFFILIGMTAEVARSAKQARKARAEAFDALDRAQTLMMSTEMQADPNRFRVKSDVREASVARPVRKAPRTKPSARRSVGAR